MKIKLGKIAKLLVVATFLVVLVVSFVYSNIQRRKAVCSELTIRFTDEIQYLSAKQIERIIYRKLPRLMGCKLDTLETDYIEDEIEKLAWVKSADIFKGYGKGEKGMVGILKVTIKQYKPKFRVQNGESGFYVSTEKRRLPLSPLHTPRVLVVTGGVNKELLEGDLFDFVTFIEKNKFWKSMIEQIHITRKKELVLVPRIGGHLIEFGPITRVEEKFENMKAMYEHGFNEETWKKYRSMSLKYKNQVICTLK